MSDTVLRFVPRDPHWQPSTEAAANAVAVVNAWLPGAETVEVSFEDQVTFYDPGQNWSGVTCNACGEDAEGWFGEALDMASHTAFSNLTVTAGCCGAITTLNDLNYTWPAAFGRFAIGVTNPDVIAIDTAALKEIETTLGCSIRQVWGHI